MKILSFKFITWVSFTSLNVTGDAGFLPVHTVGFDATAYSLSKPVSIFCQKLISSKFMYVCVYVCIYIYVI
jgi:hypothetical protein